MGSAALLPFLASLIHSISSNFVSSRTITELLILHSLSLVGFHSCNVKVDFPCLVGVLFKISYLIPN